MGDMFNEQVSLFFYSCPLQAYFLYYHVSKVDNLYVHTKINDKLLESSDAINHKTIRVRNRL